MNQALINACRAPITSRCATRYLALTTSDASVSLPEGGYEFALRASTDLAVIGLGVATTGLPNNSALTDGISVVPSLGAGEFVVEGTTPLHARVLSGTAELYIVKKADV